MDNTLSGILKDVCMVLHLKETDVMSKVRTRDLVEARVIFSNIAREATYHNLTEIANTICRDHSSVVYYQKTHIDLLKYDTTYKRKLRECKAIIVPRKKMQEEKLRCLMDRVYYRNQFLSNRLQLLMEENKSLKETNKKTIDELNVLQKVFEQGLSREVVKKN